MTWYRALLVPGIVALAAASLAAAPADASLDAALARLDEASASFRSLTADIKKLAHTDVVNVDDVETGSILVKRLKPRDTRIRIDFTSPKRKSLTIGEGKAQIFYPQSNEAQEAELGKNRGIVDQFMLLGFGSNSAELKSAYTVTLGGADTVNGEKATRVLLVPRDKEVLKLVKQCELWISEKGWTIQQKFHTGGGDYVLSTYSRMNFNPSISDKELKLDLPKGVKFGKLK